MLTSDPEMAPATVLPPSWYHDPDVYQRERVAVFGHEWLFVTDAGRLSAPGDYLGLVVAGYPLVVVNDDGTLRGFHNVCRHRGGPLVWDGPGTARSLVCRYHGWAYGLDGCLHSARDFGGQALCRDELSLRAVRVDTWRGLVFANMDAGAPALVDWLGGFAGECAGYPMESFRVSHRASHELNANWKVYAENYQEGYHIPIVHPRLNRQVDCRRYQVEVGDGYCVHRAPARDGSVTSGAWLWRFPSLALNVYTDGMSVESYAPTGPVTTKVDFTFFVSPPTSADGAMEAVTWSTGVLDEDRTICEAVQRNVQSGLYTGGLLSPRHEDGVRYLQEMVLQALTGA